MSTKYFTVLQLKFIFKRSNIVCDWPSNSPDLSPVEMMWSIVKFSIFNYPIDLKPINREQLLNAIQKEWGAIDMETVKRLVNSFKKRLEMCIHVCGKTIAPYLKPRIYDISKIQREEPPFIFTEKIDQFLIQKRYQSWKQTGLELNYNSNLIKYRTNVIQHQFQNDSTQKINLLLVNNDFIPKKFYLIPYINGYFPEVNEQKL